ncbi:MAG: YncE family protein [Candidatus Parvarchaeota archaeon]
MRGRRSQSALEYMMTYGWAILIIVIVAVVLYSMGIFSPSSFVSFTGVTGMAGLQPASALCASNGQLVVKLSDALGTTIQISSITANTSAGVSKTQSESAVISPGSTDEFSIFGICPTTSGTSYTMTITAYYTEPNSAFPSVVYSLSGTAKGSSSSPPMNTFTAYGLPTSVPWTVVYGGINQTITGGTGSSMSFVSLPNSAFTIYPTVVNGVTYYPIYAAGNNISAGYSMEVDFIPMRNLWFANQGANNVSMIYWENNTLAVNKVSGSKGFVIVGTGPWSVAVTPNGQYVYVANGGSNTVSVISTSNDSVFKTISVGVQPVSVAITPNGQYVYVTNYNSNTTSVISTSTNSVLKNISVGYSPDGVAITPNGQYAYVTNVGTNSVSVISTSTNSVVSTISVGSNPQGVAITPNGQYAYVVNAGYGAGGATVSVISTSTNSVVSTISVGTDPRNVAITPNGQYAYVTNSGSGAGTTISVISTSTNSVVSTISVSTWPNGITITPNGQYAYVTNSASNLVSVISTSTNQVVATITTPANSNPCGISYGPLGSTA